MHRSSSSSSSAAASPEIEEHSTGHNQVSLWGIDPHPTSFGHSATSPSYEVPRLASHVTMSAHLSGDADADDSSYGTTTTTTQDDGSVAESPTDTLTTFPCSHPPTLGFYAQMDENLALESVVDTFTDFPPIHTTFAIPPCLQQQQQQQQQQQLLLQLQQLQQQQPQQQQQQQHDCGWDIENMFHTMVSSPSCHTNTMLAGNDINLTSHPSCGFLGFDLHGLPSPSSYSCSMHGLIDLDSLFPPLFSPTH